jgi:Mycotoxin biosynthesis protein UstYa
MDVTYNKIRFNATFAVGNIYRDDASPEVDQAWEDLGISLGHVSLPPNRAADFGLDPGMVKLNPEYGGGLVANVEVFHQLHCLVS